MSEKIDNAELYEQIGDLVIGRAHAGDKDCLRIFELALRKTEGQSQKSKSE